MLTKTCDSTTLTPDKFDLATLTVVDGKVNPTYALFLALFLALALALTLTLALTLALAHPSLPPNKVKYTQLSEAEAQKLLDAFKEDSASGDA